MRQRRIAPAWLVDQAALVALAESRLPAQAAAVQAMASASILMEKSFIGGKVGAHLVATDARASSINQP